MICKTLIRSLRIFIYHCLMHDSLLTFLWQSHFHDLMQFLETGPELSSHYNDVIASQDVATYGGLCALATFDRAELKASSTIYFRDNPSYK